MYCIFCGYNLNYKVDQIGRQDDAYIYLFQKTFEKRDKQDITQVLSYQYIWPAIKVYTR